MTETASEAPGRKQWASRFGFLMAAVGAAVGLGNLWRFPFQTGQNGGSAFVIVYLLCVALIAWPIVIAELSVGRRKGLSAVGSTRELAKDVGASPLWGVIGVLGIAASFLVLTTYSFIAGQIMSFSAMSFMGVFKTQEASSTLPLYNGTLHSILWFSAFIGLTMLVVAGGLRAGIERLVTIAMPLFFILLLGLTVYALSTGAAGKTIDYLFSPRFHELTPNVVLAALGQAFYSVAVGAAAMLTYGAYLDRNVNIAANAGIIAGTDTIVALVAGLMIFPIVFAYSLDPAAGMGLIFEALPYTFSSMPAGWLIGGFFFLLAFIAALTSSISMLMVGTTLAEEWLKWKRLHAVLILGGTAWLIGAVSTQIPHMAERIDFTVGSIFMPVGGLLCSIFVGWIVPRAIMRDELHNASEGMFGAWRFLIRYLVPIAVAAILVMGVLG